MSAAEKIEAVTKILHKDWDPIGCGVPEDEYASYAPRVGDRHVAPLAPRKRIARLFDDRHEASAATISTKPSKDAGSQHSSASTLPTSAASAR